MLPSLYYQCYQKFWELLEQMQGEAATNPLDLQKLRQGFLTIQQFFQQQIANMDTSSLDPVDAPRVRSYQTEISKQLNLLGVDVMFLQAARQAQTAETRLVQISQRLQTLISYCSAITEGRGVRRSQLRAGVPPVEQTGVEE